MTLKAVISSIFLLPLFGINTNGQNPKVDSLSNLISKTTSDSILIRLNIEVGTIFLNTRPDSASYYFNRTLDLSSKNLESSSLSAKDKFVYSKYRATSHLKIGIINYYLGNYEKAIEYYRLSLNESKEIQNYKGVYSCSNNIGLIFNSQGKYDIAIEYYNNSLDAARSMGDSLSISNCYANLGGAYLAMGNYNKALNYFLTALRNFENLQNSIGQFSCYNNLSIIYTEQKEYQNAINYLFKALNNAEKTKNQFGISQVYYNIGRTYGFMSKYDEVLKYYKKALKISEEIGDKQGISRIYMGLGQVYSDKKDFKSSIESYNKSLRISEELDDRNGISISYGNLANAYYLIADSVSNSEEQIKNLKISLDYYKKAYTIADEIKVMRTKNFAAMKLMYIYKTLGNYKASQEYAEIYIETKDSLFNEAKNKEINGLQLSYERDKNIKEKAILEKDKTIIQEKAQKQKIIILSISIGLGFLVFMVTFILRRLQITRKQKKIIECQNGELIAKNDQISKQNIKITDSITYASRIQNAMLPPALLLERVLPEHFIFYKPLDIVSGDFYWGKQIDNILYIAVADCTGHGVPGAFMSMLGISQLNEIVARNHIKSPNHILNELRSSIKSSLHQEGQKGQTQDGMDIAFCAINLNTFVLEYSGAHNPLYIIRGNELDGESELIEIRADNIPIGVHPRDNMEFTNHSFNLVKGDSIYLFSDGFTSQFGGEKHETFKSKRFQETILKMQNVPMVEQQAVLEDTLNEWKGEYDQVDDILVIGVKI